MILWKNTWVFLLFVVFASCKDKKEFLQDEDSGGSG